MSVAEISAEHREQNGSHESSVKQQEDHTPSSGEDIAPEVIGKSIILPDLNRFPILTTNRR